MKVAKQKLTAELSWQFKRIGPPQMAPDGSFVIAPVTQCDLNENQLRTSLWYFPVEGGEARALTSACHNSIQAAISPDGRQLAFLSCRDQDTGLQLYILPLAGGEARRITQLPVGISEFTWFPDGQSLAFVARVLPGFTDWESERAKRKARQESKTSALIWDKAPVTDWDRFVDEGETHIFRCDSNGGSIKPLTVALKRPLPDLTGGPLGGSCSFAIHPDGHSLALVSVGNSEPGHYKRDIFLIDLREGTARNLTADNPGADFCPQFSPDGKHLAWLRKTIAGFYGDTNRMMLADAQGNKPRTLHADWDRSPHSYVWAPDSQSFFAEVDDSAHLRLYQIPLVDDAPRALTQSMSYSNPSVSTQPGSMLAALVQSFTAAPALVLVDPQTGSSRRLSQLNDELESSIAWGHYESVHYEGAEGRSIQMWVNYPPDFDPNRTYPLFLMNHGGPHNGIVDAMQWRWNAQVFAAMGYVVAWHNFHGSSGFGQEFADSINPDWTSKPYEDTIRAAAYFQEQRWIDSKRMIAGGGSFGGYLTAVLLGREHPFQALIAHAAVYNRYSQYASDFHFIRSRYGDFWDDQQNYEATSPHLRAAHFKTPTLIIHGQLDYRVPVTQALELFHTLQGRGVPSRFIYFPDENHWILKPQNSLLWYREVAQWLQQYAPADQSSSSSSS